MLGVFRRRVICQLIGSTVDGRHFVTYLVSRLLLKLWELYDQRDGDD